MALGRLSVCTLSLLVVVVDYLVNAQSLQLVYIERRSNRITLDCRQNSSPISSPQLWVQRSDLPVQLVNLESSQGGRIIFVITQDMEGMYYCSKNMVMSNTLDLVAYPDPNFSLPSSYFFEAADMATGTINCRIMPGKLRQYYSVTWKKDDQLLVSSAEPMQPKYQVNDDFSLTINNIELSDNSTNYWCTVTIDDPQTPGSASDKVYDRQQLGDIAVMVYETPKIVLPLRPAVHRENQGSVTFTCRARGTPTPTMSWFLNERIVTQLDDSRFREHSSTAGAITTGQLTVTELHAADSGILKCVAAASVQTTSAVQKFDISQATLSVLTADFEPVVVITTGGDVQFHLTLPAAIPETLRLRIQFVAEDNVRNVRNQTSTGAYTNLTKIFYEVQNSRVPLQRFKVQLALMVKNNVGPYVPTDLEFATVYDLRFPTDDCDDYRDKLAVVCPIAGSALVVTVVIVIVIGYLVRKQMKASRNRQCAADDRNHANELLEKAERAPEDQKQQIMEEVHADLEHARNVTKDGESDEEDTETQSQPNSIHTSEATAQL